MWRALALRARLLRSDLHDWAMKQMLWRISGIWVGSLVGAQELRLISNREETSRGWKKRCQFWKFCDHESLSCTYDSINNMSYPWDNRFLPSSGNNLLICLVFWPSLVSSKWTLLLGLPYLSASSHPPSRRWSVFSLNPLNAIPVFCGHSLLSTGVTIPAPLTPRPVPAVQPIFSSIQEPKEPAIFEKCTISNTEEICRFWRGWKCFAFELVACNRSSTEDGRHTI